jgi:serine protein kinase
MDGISPRYVQDKISNALVSEKGEGAINPFMVINELESGLRHHSLISNDDVRKRYSELLQVVKQEYEDIVKNEVQRAISADEDADPEAVRQLHRQHQGVHPAREGQEPVHRPGRGARRADDAVDRGEDRHPESRKDDFRREIMNYIGALAIEGRTFDYKTNERLHKALEAKLFEDQKDSIKLTSLVSSVVDRETQAKIDIVKQRLIKNFGYDEVSATDVLNYVASIFARGDVKS